MSTINIGTSSNTAFKVESDTTGALTIKTGAGLTTAVTVSAAGNMGLGVTPTDTSNYYKIQIGGTTGGILDLLTGSTRHFSVYCGASNSVLGTVSNTPLIFQTNDATKMTLDASGNLGLGVTPQTWYATNTRVMQFTPSVAMGSIGGTPFVALNYYTDAAGTNRYISTNPASQYVQEVNTGAHVWKLAASGNAGDALTWTTVMALSAPAGYLTVPGIYNDTAAASNTVNVTSGGELYRVVSALKYKTNVRDLESVDINVLRPVRYNSNCRLDDPTKDQLGFIADEIAAAGYTELVNYGPDGAVEGLQYDRITVLLVKAIQELAAEVAALKGAK